jgi:hypothetical protein
MAIHNSVPSMLQESLPEMLLVAKFCIEFKKESPPWPAPGCYGYPAALILLSIVDSIGSYIEKGTVQNHFRILNNKDYCNQNLGDQELKIIYKYYRNILSHHSVLPPNVVLSIGTSEEPLFESKNGEYYLRLIPLYNWSVIAVEKILTNPDVFKNNQTIKNIELKKIK